MKVNTSNSKNYIKTYIWQGLALCLRFLSLFIVVPFLSSEPKIYGIYAVCISVLIFLNYADLGFLISSIKYATESFAKGNRKDEMKFIGFGSFVLLLFGFLISIIFLFYSIYPFKLVDGLDTPELKHIASSLMLILSIFTPLIVLQRMVSIIFNIRLHGYVNKIVSIVFSIIAIISTFYFFSNGKYLIVEYFLFFHSLNFISTIIMFVIAKKRYDYDIVALFKCIKFDKKIFSKSKKLAYSSLFTMISWVCFYEIDQVVIGKFIGVEKVALFAIAIMFATLFRSIFSIIFTPFNVRANYFVGNNDDDGLKEFIKRVLILTAPITILPTVALSIVSEPLILSWVGASYKESIVMSRIFALLFTFSFITYSASAYIISKEKIKEMYYISISLPIIYWLGVYISYPYFNINAFPIFKLTAIIISVIYYIFLLKKDINFTWSFFLKDVLGGLFFPLVALFVILGFALKYLPIEKSKFNFLVVAGFTGCVILFSFIIQFFASKKLRKLVLIIIKDIKK